MTRKDEIKTAYRQLGTAHGFYDRMMLGESFLGRMVDRLVWDMDREDLLEYQARVFEVIPEDFFGRILTDLSPDP